MNAKTIEMRNKIRALVARQVIALDQSTVTKDDDRRIRLLAEVEQIDLRIEEVFSDLENLSAGGK